MHLKVSPVKQQIIHKVFKLLLCHYVMSDIQIPEIFAYELAYT